MKTSVDTNPLEGEKISVSRSRPRLLVVDDESVHCQTLFEIFHREYEVFLADSGDNALQMCRIGLPDLILLDVMMPGMGGLETCRRLKEDPSTRNIPILFVTALENSDDEAQALDAGGVDFITKPVNPTVVRARVRTHLTLKSQADLLRFANREMLLKNQDLLKTENILSAKIAELEAALNRVRQLEGIIPICMYCKKIRNDENYWQQIEQFISKHTQAEFSHGICPACLEEHYGDLLKRKVDNVENR